MLEINDSSSLIPEISCCLERSQQEAAKVRDYIIILSFRLSVCLPITADALEFGFFRNEP